MNKNEYKQLRTSIKCPLRGKKLLINNIKQIKMKNSMNGTAVYKWLKCMQVSLVVIVTAMMCLTLSGCDKEDLGEKFGTIKYQNDVYSVSIGEISKNSKGNVTVELVGDMKGTVIISQGKMVPVIGMRIVVGSKNLEYEGANISAGLYEYEFNTTKNPDKIIVYSNDGSGSTLTFHGKKKRVIN